MTCATCESLIDAFVDGELMASEALDTRAHIDTCAGCADRLSQRLALSRQLQGAARYQAPDVLRARVRGIAGAPASPFMPPKTSRPGHLRRAAIAAAAVIAIAIAGGLAVQRSGGSTVPDQVLASHLRSLLPGRLIDVQSTDRHNVKPWFNGRIALSPDVPTLDSAGYALVGGRVDYVGTTLTAVVVYRRRQHVISVFSWPAPKRRIAPSTETRNGFQLIHLARDGVERWIVSDLNRQELEDFSRHFSGAP
jgi:anti-sigma factor RsiW